jgi:hypothetical protein
LFFKFEPIASWRRISSASGDADHLKVFANAAAETWFEEHDPEGVAFEYEVLE